jgi:hypothetical protein
MRMGVHKTVARSALWIHPSYTVNLIPLPLSQMVLVGARVVARFFRRSYFGGCSACRHRHTVFTTQPAYTAICRRLKPNFLKISIFTYVSLCNHRRVKKRRSSQLDVLIKFQSAIYVDLHPAVAYDALRAIDLSAETA